MIYSFWLFFSFIASSLPNTKLGTINSDVHAIYVSVIEIEKNKMDNNGTMKVKVFFDDLEEAIYHQTKKRRSYAEGCQFHDKELQAYFNHYLKLKINSISIEFKLFNCERLEDALWLSFNFKNTKDWDQLYVSAKYFMELFPTQSNVVSITNGVDKKFVRLYIGNQEADFNFQN